MEGGGIDEQVMIMGLDGAEVSQSPLKSTSSQPIVFKDTDFNIDFIPRKSLRETIADAKQAGIILTFSRPITEADLVEDDREVLKSFAKYQK